MVKLAKAASQDPKDPSLQMKVIIMPFSSASMLSWAGKSQRLKNPVPEFGPSDSSLEIMWWRSPNSGIIWEGSTRRRLHRDRFCLWMKFWRRGRTILKLMGLCCDTSRAQASTTCIRNSVMYHSTVPSANCTWRWPATTVPAKTPFLSFELQFSTRKMMSGEQRAHCLGIIVSSSQLSERFPVRAIKDTEPSSKPIAPTPSNSDHTQTYLNSNANNSWFDGTK